MAIAMIMAMVEPAMYILVASFDDCCTCVVAVAVVCGFG